jgi:hypothetical protein
MTMSGNRQIGFSFYITGENVQVDHRKQQQQFTPASPLKLPSQSRCAEHIAVYYFQTGYLQDIAAGSV